MEAGSENKPYHGDKNGTGTKCHRRQLNHLSSSLVVMLVVVAGMMMAVTATMPVSGQSTPSFNWLQPNQSSVCANSDVGSVLDLSSGYYTIYAIGYGYMYPVPFYTNQINNAYIAWRTTPYLWKVNRYSVTPSSFNGESLVWTIVGSPPGYGSTACMIGAGGPCSETSHCRSRLYTWETQTANGICDGSITSPYSQTAYAFRASSYANRVGFETVVTKTWLTANPTSAPYHDWALRSFDDVTTASTDAHATFTVTRCQETGIGGTTCTPVNEFGNMAPVTSAGVPIPDTPCLYDRNYTVGTAIPSISWSFPCIGGECFPSTAGKKTCTNEFQVQILNEANTVMQTVFSVANGYCPVPHSVHSIGGFTIPSSWPPGQYRLAARHGDSESTTVALGTIRTFAVNCPIGSVSTSGGPCTVVV